MDGFEGRPLGEEVAENGRVFVGEPVQDLREIVFRALVRRLVRRTLSSTRRRRNATSWSSVRIVALCGLSFWSVSRCLMNFTHTVCLVESPPPVVCVSRIVWDAYVQGV